MMATLKDDGDERGFSHQPLKLSGAPRGKLRALELLLLLNSSSCKASFLEKNERDSKANSANIPQNTRQNQELNRN